ncbi:hypothetical protein Tco_0798336 [Tanacetum coccineum]
MASSSSSFTYLIKFHLGRVFVRGPFSYAYEILTEIPNVDMVALNFVSFVKLLVSECSSDTKQFFYHVLGLELKLGLRIFKNDEDLAQCIELGDKNGNVLDIYVSHTVFELHDATSSSQQDVGIVELNDNSNSDLSWWHEEPSHEDEDLSHEDEEPRHEAEEQVQVPKLVVIRRESERIKQLKFKNPPSPRPGLDPEDAIEVD